MTVALTLDDDIAARVEREQRKRNVTFDTVVNDLLRTGLNALEIGRAHGKSFETRAVHLGPSLIGSLDDVEGALSRAAAEDHA